MAQALTIAVTQRLQQVRGTLDAVARLLAEADAQGALTQLALAKLLVQADELGAAAEGMADGLARKVGPTIYPMPPRGT